MFFSCSKQVFYDHEPRRTELSWNLLSRLSYGRKKIAGQIAEWLQRYWDTDGNEKQRERELHQDSVLVFFCHLNWQSLCYLFMNKSVVHFVLTAPALSSQWVDWCKNSSDSCHHVFWLKPYCFKQMQSPVLQGDTCSLTSLNLQED